MVCAAQPWQSLPWAQAWPGLPGSFAEPSDRAGTTWCVCREGQGMMRQRGGCARRARCLPSFFLGCSSWLQKEMRCDYRVT